MVPPVVGPLWQSRAVSGDRGLDALLGIGGLLLVVGALVAVSNLQGDAVNTVVGLSMVAWIGLISWRHVTSHRGGSGARLIAISWVLLGVLSAWTLVQAADTAAFDDGVLTGLGSMAGSPPAVVVMLPLVLASVAILRERSTAA
jgi:hypothetical protein